MSKNITKLDLCNKIAKRLKAEKLKQPVNIVKDVIEMFLDEILESLSEDDRIEIRGFGAFNAKTRNPRVGRNPRTGEIVKIPSYKAPHFKFSKEAQNIFDSKKGIKG